MSGKPVLEDKESPSAFVGFHSCGDEDDDAERRKFQAEERAKSRLVARFLSGRLGIYVGDIADQRADAIVNAANSSLMGGSGVDGAIHRKGGAALSEACATLRDTTHPDGLRTGDAVITTGGSLLAEFVIHTVGPIYGQHNGQEAVLLEACYRSCFALAKKHQLMKIAFPSISTGAYGYPRHKAAKVVWATLSELLVDQPKYFEVRLVFLHQEDADIFVEEAHQIKKIFPGEPENEI